MVEIMLQDHFIVCSETASASKSTSWMPAAGSASAAAAPGANAVAFDEMSQIDVNRRDSELADMPASAQLGSTSFKSQVRLSCVLSHSCLWLNSIKNTLIIPQGAILLGSWWAHKIMNT